MVHNLLNQTLLRQMSDSNAGERTVNFQPLDKYGLGDESEGGDVFQDAVVGRLVENDGVLCLILDLALGPLFLLGGLAAR